MHPKEIQIGRNGESLIIEWSDDSVSTIPGKLLRNACDCSECLSRNRPGQFSLLMMSAPGQRIRSIDLLSSSRLHVIWDDGHDRSIYNFARLRETFSPLPKQSQQRPDRIE